MPLRRASLFIIKNMKKIIQSVKTNLLDTVIIIIVSVMYLLNNRYIKIATSGILHEFFVCYFNDLMAPMFMLAYTAEGKPVLGLPGCVMYAGRTIFDLVLPRLMADEPVSAEYLAGLGEGGLCLGCEVCSFPNCGFGK